MILNVVDGATHAQATMVALGKDPTIEDAEFPAIGWYRCKREYAEIYCHDHEMEETDHRDTIVIEAKPEDRK